MGFGEFEVVGVVCGFVMVVVMRCLLDDDIYLGSSVGC